MSDPRVMNKTAGDQPELPSCNKTLMINKNDELMSCHLLKAMATGT